MYNIYSIEREFLTDTLVSFYSKPTGNRSRKRKIAVTHNGERMRQDLITGELERPTRSEYEQSDLASIKRTRIAMNAILKLNTFSWFCTLTFDKERIDRTDDRQVMNCYVNYINLIKKSFPDLRYICFPERHDDEDKCIHFHLLIGGVTTEQLGLENSGKVCCSWATRSNGVASKEYFDKTKEGRTLTDTDGLTIYNITTFAYGLTTATRIANKDKTDNYVKKYISKALGSTDVFQKRFYYSSNLLVPNVVKRLIAPDFNGLMVDEAPKVQCNILVRHAKMERTSLYGVKQIWVDNTVKYASRKGLVPLKDTDKDAILINKVFKE